MSGEECCGSEYVKESGVCEVRKHASHLIGVVFGELRVRGVDARGEEQDAHNHHGGEEHDTA